MVEAHAQVVLPFRCAAEQAAGVPGAAAGAGHVEAVRLRVDPFAFSGGRAVAQLPGVAELPACRELPAFGLGVGAVGGAVDGEAADVLRTVGLRVLPVDLVQRRFQIELAVEEVTLQAELVVVGRVGLVLFGVGCDDARGAAVAEGVGATTAEALREGGVAQQVVAQLVARVELVVGLAITAAAGGVLVVDRAAGVVDDEHVGGVVVLESARAEVDAPLRRDAVADFAEDRRLGVLAAQVFSVTLVHRRALGCLVAAQVRVQPRQEFREAQVALLAGVVDPGDPVPGPVTFGR